MHTAGSYALHTQMFLERTPPSPTAMGYRCVCTTGTVRHKAVVKRKSQREKLFSDMS